MFRAPSRSRRPDVLLAATLVFTPVCHAADAWHASVTVGTPWMSDEFNTTGPAGQFYVPLTARLKSGEFAWTLSVPRLVSASTQAAQAAGFNGINTRTLDPASMPEDRSWGDASLAFAWRPTELQSANWTTALVARQRFSSPYQKVELGVADDRLLRLDIARNVGAITARSSAGYKVRQAIDGGQRRTGPFGYSGASLAVGESSYIDLLVAYRRIAALDHPLQAEASIAFGHSVTRDFALHGYLLKGATTGNRSWVAGVMLTTRWPP